MSQNKLKNLSKLRKKITALDVQIIGSLSKRLKIAMEIGKLKKALKIEVYDPKREERLKKFHAKICKKYKVSGKLAESLFNLIMDETKRIQKAKK